MRYSKDQLKGEAGTKEENMTQAANVSRGRASSWNIFAAECICNTFNE